ncbi:MAG: sulfite exporter TauE/SafE family protein [Myxococcales bacterium]|nr:sulfite exporter TauE/SafE family protein [Myxococcales bacterium]
MGLWILAVGWVAGMVTTVAGMGGGMILILALAAGSGDPVYAIAVSTPALLVGNAHRLWLFREHVQWSVAAPFVVAAVPGAMVGGAFVTTLPDAWVQTAMLLAALLAIARYVGWLVVKVTPLALAPMGFGVGVASTVGGAGALAGPILLSVGLSGSAYIATMSLSALSMHLGRLVAFGATGQVDGRLLVLALGLAAMITVGNAMGRRVRQALEDGTVRRLELGTAVGLVFLAVGGLAT